MCSKIDHPAGSVSERSHVILAKNALSPCRRRVRVDRQPSRRHFLSRVVRDRSPLCARCRRRLPPPTPRPPRARPWRRRRSSSSARRRRRPRRKPRLRRKRRSSRRGRFAASPAGPSPSGWCSTPPSSSSPPRGRGYVPRRYRRPPAPSKGVGDRGNPSEPLDTTADPRRASLSFSNP
jgi:hypothetical protein